MKKIIIIILASFLLFGNCIAQTKKEKHIEYLVLWVKYHVGSTIESKLTIDIGKDKYHSLHGIASNGEAGIVIINEEGNLKPFNNEVDLLNYLNKLGWEVKSIKKHTMLSKEYFKYLMTKKID